MKLFLILEGLSLVFVLAFNILDTYIYPDACGLMLVLPIYILARFFIYLGIFLLLIRAMSSLIKKIKN